LPKPVSDSIELIGVGITVIHWVSSLCRYTPKYVKIRPDRAFARNFF